MSITSITEGHSTDRVIVEMEPHHRPIMFRDPHLTTTPRRTYVVVNERGPMTMDEQVAHDHRPFAADSYGDCICHCGAFLWSPWWVAAGIHGHGTDEWMRQHENSLIHRAMTGHEVSS